MAMHIETELSEANKTIYAIWAMTQEALKQAYREETAPYWAVTLSLLAESAQNAMQGLHERLEAELGDKK